MAPVSTFFWRGCSFFLLPSFHFRTATELTQFPAAHSFVYEWLPSFYRLITDDAALSRCTRVLIGRAIFLIRAAQKKTQMRFSSLPTYRGRPSPSSLSLWRQRGLFLFSVNWNSKSYDCSSCSLVLSERFKPNPRNWVINPKRFHNRVHICWRSNRVDSTKAGSQDGLLSLSPSGSIFVQLDWFHRGEVTRFTDGGCDRVD